MKYSVVLGLAALGSAFVLPAQEVFADIAIDEHREQPLLGETWFEEAVSAKNALWSSLRKSAEELTRSVKHVSDDVLRTAANTFDQAINQAEQAKEDFSDLLQESPFDAESWLESVYAGSDDEDDDFKSIEDPPHGEPPHHKRPHHKRPHHRRPHHGHEKPNASIYELISESKYTTQLAFLINQYPDLVETLNSTKANYTLFAPIDRAFEKIPEHAPKPSKEELKALLSYHVVPGFYPAGRVLVSHTVPTLLEVDSLGKEPLPQRLSFHLNLRGLTVNFYSRIISINHPATNGVIHAVDSLILPPPKAIKIIDLLPSEFSTLELGLAKTGLLEAFNSSSHPPGTLFAPSNRAFAKLGPRINAFLFSQHGLKYLKALLEYHVAPKNVLYSDAFYSAGDADQVSVPKGRFHVDLPTLLKNRDLSIDVARFGGFITIRINAFARVAVQDGIAADGVIHALGDVLIPPKKIGRGETSYWNGEDIEVEDLVERLDPFVSDL